MDKELLISELVSLANKNVKLQAELSIITKTLRITQENLRKADIELKAKDELLREAMPALYENYRSDDLVPGSLPCRIEQALKGNER